MDNLPVEEKERCSKAMDDLQSTVFEELNAHFLGQAVEVLVESKNEKKNRWFGRTRTDRLVFFEAVGEWLGRMPQVMIA